MDERILAENRTLVSINSSKQHIDSFKIGTINYVVEDGELFVTDVAATDHTEAIYSRLIKENPNGKINHDLIFEGNVTVEQNLKVLGDAVAIPVDSVSLQDTVLELNRGEAHNGIMNKRSGVTINRGEKGYASIFYDEASGGFNLCLDHNPASDRGDSTIESKLIMEFSKFVSAHDGEQVFALPGAVNPEKDAFMVFINSVYYGEANYEVNEYSVEIKTPLLEGDEVFFSRISVRQKSIITPDRPVTEDRVASLKKSAVTISVSYDGEARFTMPYTYDKEKETSIVFINGTILPPSEYSIDDNILYISPFLSESDEVVAAFIRTDSLIAGLSIVQSNYSELVPFNGLEVVAPFLLDKEGDAILVFKNSVLMEPSEYSLEGDKLILKTAYSEDVHIDIFRLAPFNTSSYSERLNEIREADYFDNLFTVSEHGEAKAKKSVEAMELISTKSSSLSDVTIEEKKFGKALTVNGKSTVNGIAEYNGPIYSNDISEFRKESTFKDRVNLKKEVIFDKNEIFLNRALEAQNGGVKFERSLAGNAVLSWKEGIKKWCAGIEGTEKPIITQGELYHIIDKLIDICDLDTDIHTSIKTETYTLYSDGSESSKDMKIPYSKEVGETELVFRNGILANENDYKIIGNRIEFSEVLWDESEINIVRIYLNQVSLIGVELKDDDKDALIKESYEAKAYRDSQRDFILPFDLYEYTDSIFVFANGALLTKDMYSITGSLISLLYDCKEDTRIDVVSISVVQNMSFNRIYLSSKNIKVEAKLSGQNEFYIPAKINLEKQDIVLFGNTVFIPDSDYEIEGRTIKIKSGASIPTELTVIILNPFNKRGFGIPHCGNNEANPFGRYFHDVGIPYQSEFKVPFRLSAANSSLLVFYNGRSLSREQYDITEMGIKVFEPQEEARIAVMDFVTEFDESFEDSRLGVRSFDFIIEDSFKNEYKLPFSVGKDETNMLFIDGLFVGKHEYGIDGDLVIIYKDFVGGERVVLNNFSKATNVQYLERPVLKDKYIHEQEHLEDTWVIKHNLDTYPHVTVLADNNKVMRDVEIRYLDMNTIAVELTNPRIGKAILN